ncbi:unnamed protein product [Cuscuta campestris]|uniref:Uncharacterized protein n=1 Tax=Cuscuta campestris TaxID=132261 RepID=A0A484MQI9_9ASTE|nr:unnamed protein product [Cuscuta campestris]
MGKEITDSSNTMHLHENHGALLKENTAHVRELFDQFLLSLNHEPAPRMRATSGMENTYSSPCDGRTMHLHKNHNPLEDTVVNVEELMSQFLSWMALNTGNPRGTMIASNCGFNNGADFEDEHVTIYIHLPVRKIKPVHKESYRDEWFSISTQHLSSSKGSPFCPAFLDPGDAHGGWKEAPPLPPVTFNYYFFEANDKIYGLGIFKGLSFDLLCLDCHDLSKGWQSIHPISNELSKQHLDDTFYAFKLQYETPVDPATCKSKRRATHAVILLSNHLVSYDFDQNAFKVYDDHVPQECSWKCCTGVGHGNLFYILCQKNTYEKPYAVLMVYNDSVHKWYPTPVVGFENFPHALPVSYERFSKPELPRAQLLLIGEGRLCILWADKVDFHNAVTPIHCTKFDVQVIDEQPRAVNVSTQLFNIRGPHSIRINAVLIRRETMPQL